MYSYPKTSEEWWILVSDNKDNLFKLVESYHPFFQRNYDCKITAPAAEQICEIVRKEIVENTTNPLVLFEEYLKNKNANLVSIFNDTWFGMPESESVRYAPGFGILCDLCSESYVLEEQDIS
jgi:hypothetical protein